MVGHHQRRAAQPLDLVRQQVAALGIRVIGQHTACRHSSSWHCMSSICQIQNKAQLQQPRQRGSLSSAQLMR